MARTLPITEKKLLDIKKQAADLDQLYFDSLEEYLRNSKYSCGSCKKKSKISESVLVLFYWYTQPYGCTGGDYWNLNDIVEIICPKCGVLNSVHQDEDKTRINMHRFKDCFAGFLRAYDYSHNFYTRERYRVHVGDGEALEFPISVAVTGKKKPIVINKETFARHGRVYTNWLPPLK